MTNPPYILEHLESIAEIMLHDNVYSFLHVPVQSGSDEVLGAMRREYNCADFCTVVDTLRAKVPDMNIATGTVIFILVNIHTEEKISSWVLLIDKILLPVVI